MSTDTAAPPTPPTLSRQEQQILLRVAAEAIRARLEDRPPQYGALGSFTGALAAECATFVSLHDEDGSLLGCIGSLAGYRPLVQDVAENALAAAFADPRLPPLTAEQFTRMEIEVSVLSELVPLWVDSMPELETSLVPGADGVLITSGRHRATFLPAVWRQTRSTREFLGMLWQKAGLRPGTWPANLVVERYRTLEFHDAGPRA